MDNIIIPRNFNRENHTDIEEKIIYDNQLSHLNCRILLLLIKLVNRSAFQNKNYAFCSQKYISNILQVSERSVKRTLKILVKLEYLHIEKKSKSNIYYILDNNFHTKKTSQPQQKMNIKTKIGDTGVTYKGTQESPIQKREYQSQPAKVKKIGDTRVPYITCIKTSTIPSSDFYKKNLEIRTCNNNSNSNRNNIRYKKSIIKENNNNGDINISNIKLKNITESLLSTMKNQRKKESRK